MLQRELSIDTSRAQVVDVTDEVAALAREARGDGLLNVFVPHATAAWRSWRRAAAPSPTSSRRWSGCCRATRATGIARLRGSWRHHLLPALVSPSVTVPVWRGRLALGIWQRIVIVDLNPDNPQRTLRLSFLGEPSQERAG